LEAIEASRALQAHGAGTAKLTAPQLLITAITIIGLPWTRAANM